LPGADGISRGRGSNPIASIDRVSLIVQPPGDFVAREVLMRRPVVAALGQIHAVEAFMDVMPAGTPSGSSDL